MNSLQPNIRLRAIEPEDLDLLYHIENDMSLWNIGVTNVPYSRYTLHDYLATSADDIYADKQVRLVVENGDGRVVGLADVMNFNPQHLRAEVGIVILDAQRRQGYARGALRQLADYALRVLHLRQLYAIISADNEAALALFAKSGYQRQSELADWLYDGRHFHKAVLMQSFL